MHITRTFCLGKTVNTNMLGLKIPLAHVHQEQGQETPSPTRVLKQVRTNKSHDNVKLLVTKSGRYHLANAGLSDKRVLGTYAIFGILRIFRNRVLLLNQITK